MFENFASKRTNRAGWLANFSIQLSLDASWGGADEAVEASAVETRVSPAYGR
jgi:hypothetical protein